MKNKSIENNFILTFGYGNRSNYDALLHYIKEFKISLLIDVRQKPRAWSRRWYGDRIEQFCQEQGVEYLSETVLGNVSQTNHWISPEPQKVDGVLQNIAQKTNSQTVLLLCAEMDYHRCHRVEVAEKLQTLINRPIKHLE